MAQISENCQREGMGATDFPAPASLGNGLVYDARVTPVLRPAADPNGTPDPTLGSVIVEGRRRGFRPVQLDTKPYFDPGSAVLEFDLPEWTPTLLADEDANHIIETVTELTWTELEDDRVARVAEGGWRMIALTPRMIDFDPTVASQRYSAIWVRDNKAQFISDWHYGDRMTVAELTDTLDSWGRDGFRPISVEASTRWNSQLAEFERHFSAVILRDEIGMQEDGWRISYEIESTEALVDDVDAKRIEGFEPFYVSTGLTWPVIELTESRFTVLYARRPPQEPDGSSSFEAVVQHTLSDTELRASNDALRAQGWHVVSAASHRDPETYRKAYVAVWHRYAWVDSEDGDFSEDGRAFEALEDHVRHLMAENNVPAAQVAIATGGELVYSRAFTRAPIAYPPITVATPLAAGSIAKPITAVAALMAHGVSELDDELMDMVPPIGPVAASMGGTKPSGITLRQALQHTTGWQMSGSTTQDVRDALSLEQLPTSQDWLDFMSIQTAQGVTGDGTFEYSNFGYEMAALASKQAANIPADDFLAYETDLMRPVVFEPLRMCRTAYKRQGLLDVMVDGTGDPFVEPHYGSCTHLNPNSSCAGDVRYYLIETEHPYRSWEPGSGELPELPNPAAFTRTSLDENVGPNFVRRGTYGGSNALAGYIGAGSLVTTAEDLVRFMSSFRSVFLGETDDTALLTFEQAREMFPDGALEPNCRHPDSGLVPVVDDGLMQCYGLGWFVGNNTGVLPSWNHGGDTEATDSQLFYHPETDSVVAVLFARKVMGAGPLLGVIDQTIDLIASDTPPGEGNYPIPIAGDDGLLLGLPPLPVSDDP